jgi:MerR family redox-sensitive transcriptional activator SoxR
VADANLNAAGPTLAIGQIARAAAVEASTIRYYERQGLLPKPARAGGKRRYDAGVLQRLRVIEVAKQAGFSLREIRRLLYGFDRGATPSERWRALAEDKLRDVDALLARAEGMRALLLRGLQCGCLTLEDCELLE